MKNVSEVKITDVDIKFGTMVILLVKLSFAAIPAAFVILVIWMFIAGLFGSLLGAL